MGGGIQTATTRIFRLSVQDWGELSLVEDLSLLSFTQKIENYLFAKFRGLGRSSASLLLGMLHYGVGEEAALLIVPPGERRLHL